MNRLTLRGFDDRLAESIRSVARREGISLNQAALMLLRKGAGLADEGRERGMVGSSLDHLIGSWTQEEAVHPFPSSDFWLIGSFCHRTTGDDYNSCAFLVSI